MKTTNKGMISFLCLTKKGTQCCLLLNHRTFWEFLLNLIKTEVQKECRMVHYTDSWFLLGFTDLLPWQHFLTAGGKKSELENIISYYLQIGERNEVFWFSQPAEWPRDSWRKRQHRWDQRTSLWPVWPENFAKRPRQNCRGFPGLAEHQDHAGHNFGAKSTRYRTFHYWDVELIS